MCCQCNVTGRLVSLPILRKSSYVLCVVPSFICELSYSFLFPLIHSWTSNVITNMRTYEGNQALKFILYYFVLFSSWYQSGHHPVTVPYCSFIRQRQGLMCLEEHDPTSMAACSNFARSLTTRSLLLCWPRCLCLTHHLPMVRNLLSTFPPLLLHSIGIGGGWWNSNYWWIALSIGLPLLKAGSNNLNALFVGELATLEISASPYIVFLTRQQASFNLISLNHNVLMKNIKNISG